MIEKHEITSQMLNKIFDDLTGPNALFFKGMENFANTFQGKITTFEDMFGSAERDFGSIVNDWVGDLLNFVNNSPVWQGAHDFFVNLRELSKSVESVILTLPTTQFDALMKPFLVSWAQFNSWLGSFFQEFRNPAHDYEP